MTPEAQAHLTRAHELLRRADHALPLSDQEPLFVEAVARDCYYAAFHAAHALIFERTRSVARKHGLVHRAFGDVTKHDPVIDADLRQFLSQSYEFKRLGDYGVGSAQRVSTADATFALTTAHRFVDAVTSLLP
jgi:uncharacterized protein (UPF0332 family)